MATTTLVHTFTGGETYAPLASGVLPAFSGSFTFNMSRTGSTSAVPLFDIHFVRGSTSTVCFNQGINFVFGQSVISPVVRNVGDVPAQWTCTDWTLWSVAYRPSSTQPETVGNTVTWSLTYTPAITTPCEYGTRPAASAGSVSVITDAIISAALVAFGAPWMAYLLAPFVGMAINSGQLCGHGPPSFPAIGPAALLAPIQDKLDWLEAVVWYQLCECIPGAHPTTPYVPPVVPRPPDWPPDLSYSCDPADICATLKLILKRLDELSSSQNVAIDARTTVYELPDPYTHHSGNVHSGLTGSGTLTIAGLLGVRLEITDGLPGRQLEGNPPYIWDIGWASVSDGGAMLQEKRLTRSSQEWFPAEMGLATLFGYYLKGAETLRVTELVAGSA